MALELRSVAGQLGGKIVRCRRAGRRIGPALDRPAAHHISPAALQLPPSPPTTPSCLPPWLPSNRSHFPRLRLSPSPSSLPGSPRLPRPSPTSSCHSVARDSRRGRPVATHSALVAPRPPRGGTVSCVSAKSLRAYIIGSQAPCRSQVTPRSPTWHAGHAASPRSARPPAARQTSSLAAEPLAHGPGLPSAWLWFAGMPARPPARLRRVRPPPFACPTAGTHDRDKSLSEPCSPSGGADAGSGEGVAGSLGARAAKRWIRVKVPTEAWRARLVLLRLRTQGSGFQRSGPRRVSGRCRGCLISRHRVAHEHPPRHPRAGHGQRSGAGRQASEPGPNDESREKGRGSLMGAACGQNAWKGSGPGEVPGRNTRASGSSLKIMLEGFVS